MLQDLIHLPFPGAVPKNPLQTPLRNRVKEPALHFHLTNTQHPSTPVPLVPFHLPFHLKKGSLQRLRLRLTAENMLAERGR